jgi:hypothetical protein
MRPPLRIAALAAIAALIAGCSSSSASITSIRPTAAPTASAVANYVAYVSDTTDGTLVAYMLDPGSGSLTQMMYIALFGRGLARLGRYFCLRVVVEADRYSGVGEREVPALRVG